MGNMCACLGIPKAYFGESKMNHKLVIATLLMSASASAFAADKQVGNQASLALTSNANLSNLVEVHDPVPAVTQEALTQSLNSTLLKVSTELSYEIENFLAFREAEL
jgi:hypothetical protein